MSNTVEEILAKQFSELSKDFKPKFGNPKHIEIAKICVEVGEAQQYVLKKKRDAAALKKAQEQLSRLLRQAVYMLKEQ